MNEGEIDVYLGLDVGKGEHHGTALTPAGKKAFDKPLPNSEPRLRELFENLQASTCATEADHPARTVSDHGHRHLLAAGGGLVHRRPHAHVPGHRRDRNGRRGPAPSSRRRSRVRRPAG
ncbi:transposase [Streptomyces sp. NPDC006314]|uniref:IS110 family transposase n=1 Tax=Streptomyces sp. NPDC006314 TaxID=3154475 RepID=UPI0033BB4A32